jgi:hypothetical protein
MSYLLAFAPVRATPLRTAHAEQNLL